MQGLPRFFSCSLTVPSKERPASFHFLWCILFPRFLRQLLRQKGNSILSVVFASWAFFPISVQLWVLMTLWYFWLFNDEWSTPYISMKCQVQLEMWCFGVSALLGFAEQESCLLERRIDEGANPDVERNSSKLFPFLNKDVRGKKMRVEGRCFRIRFPGGSQDLTSHV